MCTRVNDLPDPSKGRVGWPWAADDDASVVYPEQGRTGRGALISKACWEDDTPDSLERAGVEIPRITVVTPSYNQGEFIEETIRSVLLQGYPALEYMVIDGGSTDGTVEILKKYERWLDYWVSAPDKGQSDAINKGWSRSSGQLLAFLNSDDTYLPGALWKVAKAWLEAPESVAVIGGIVHVYQGTQKRSPPRLPQIPRPAPIDLSLVGHEKWRLPQQSGFVAKAAFRDREHFLSEDLHYTMDRELYYRLFQRGPVQLLNSVLATYRLHESSKTCSQIMNMYREDAQALAKTKTGILGDDLMRTIVARGRLGQGYWKYANSQDLDKAELLKHVLRAGWYYPRYMTRKQYWRLLARCFGLDTQALKRKLFG
jgi:glycosyltransferase involved in cell wall biosynthesis